MELTTLLFLGFFAAVALLNYTLPRVLRPYCLLAASYLFTVGGPTTACWYRFWLRQHWSHGAAGW